MEDGKGAEEAPFTLDGKTDTFRKPTEHGTLSLLSQPSAAEFNDDELFHSWTFELTEPATISLRTDIEKNVDTVMYLYRRTSPTANWGRYIKKNDDHEGNLFSQIDRQASAGLYRVKVKAYKLSIRGDFTLTADCSGAGCEAEPEPSQDPGLAEILDIGEFSASDFDCDSELSNAFPVTPEYLFLTSDGDSANVDFGFRRETTDFQTSLFATDASFAFETQTIESSGPDMVAGLSLEISGFFFRLQENELFDVDQPPVGAAIEFIYTRADGSTEICSTELFAGLLF